MRHAALFCILSLLLLASTCRKQEKLEAELLGKTWLHAFEEDEGDVKVYRPNTYDFAPSRGRTGFALEPGNVVKQYDIAPTDGLEERTGQWAYGEKDKINVHLPATSETPEENYTFEIVSLKDGVLKIRREQ